MDRKVQPTLGVVWMGELLSGGPRDVGETRIPLAATLAAAWLLRAPLAYLLGSALGLPGIWVATTLEWETRAALLARLFRRGAWKRVRI